MIASPLRIYQHFHDRKEDLNVVANADGTPFDPLTATTAYVFNHAERDIDEQQRQAMRRLLEREAHGV